MSDEDDSLAQALRQSPEFPLQVRARNGVERPEGLVHQQDRWVRRQCPGHSYALPLAAR